MLEFILLLTVIFLQFVDFITTLYILREGGVEISPFVRLLIRLFSLKIGLLLAKLFVAIVAILVYLIYDTKVSIVTLSMINAFYIIFLTIFNIPNYIKLHNSNKLKKRSI